MTVLESSARPLRGVERQENGPYPRKPSAYKDSGRIAITYSYRKASIGDNSAALRAG